MPPKTGRHRRGHSVSDLSAVDATSLAALMPSQSQPQPSTSRAQGQAASNVSSGQVRPKKRKHDDQLTDINSITTDPVSATGAIADLRAVVDQQQTELDQLRALITQQQDQINSLLSVIGLVPAPASPPIAPTSGQSSSPAVVPLPAPTRSYADTVHVVPSLSAPLRQAVVTAVYRDLKEHDRRTRNIVISGLAVGSDGPDDSRACSLLECEFGVRPDIVKCRRLGKLQQAKIQPLLVTLRTDGQAEYYVDRAKQLRQSTNVYTRQHIFINRDVTKAEAQAAYITRCERRQRAVQSSNRRPGQGAVSVHHASVDVRHSATMDVMSNIVQPGLTVQPTASTSAPASSTVPAAGMNLNATVFCPPTQI